MQILHSLWWSFTLIIQIFPKRLVVNTNESIQRQTITVGGFLLVLCWDRQESYYSPVIWPGTPCEDLAAFASWVLGVNKL